MRALFAATIGLALLATACSGSTSTTTSATTGGLIGVTSGGGMPAGSACTYNGACASGVCDLTGTGNCCLAACTTGDPNCGATGCDSSGTCLYPQPSVNCGSSCTQAMSTPANCDGSGNCEVGSPTACPANFGCNDDGGCNSSCASSSDCASGFVCNAGVCGAPISTGACTESDACKSGACGVPGQTGPTNCCLNACSTSNATCGATSCTFDAGTCVFPDRTVTCGDAESCANGTQTNPTVCDGFGNCPVPTTVACTPFVCGPTACLTSCTVSTDCTSGDFCDTSYSNCCTGLTNLGNMAVDSATGSDSACCGIGGKNPCKTLAHAMKLIDAAGAQSVTINASVSGGGGDWPATETYPIVLGWGVNLKAPGIYFSDPNGKQTSIIDIKAYSSSDTIASASVVGTSGNTVHIGFNASGGQSTDTASIEVESGGALSLAAAQVNGSATNKTTAILVRAAGTLVLGENQFGDVTGPVTIGNSTGKSPSDGYDGIVCGTASGMGCTISDVSIGGTTVTIQGQDDHAIDAEDYAVISLTANPVVGIPPTAPGFTNCAVKLDASAHNDETILLNGLVTMTFASGTVQCIAGDGFVLKATTAGSPALAVRKSTIQNTENGIHALAGTATVSNSNIVYNYNGVEQDTDGTNIGTIDLSGGKIGGTNTVACASNAESVTTSPSSGIAVLNTTTATLNASNVDWDTSAPDTFSCTAALVCTCESSSGCSTTPGANGMDAVYEAAGLITTTGNGLSPLSCAIGVPCGSTTCPKGDICCANDGYGGCDTCEPSDDEQECEYECGSD